MTYTPKEWQCDDFITAGELNRMERGIQEAMSGGGDIPTNIITKDDFIVVSGTTPTVEIGGMVQISWTAQELGVSNPLNELVVLNVAQDRNGGYRWGNGYGNINSGATTYKNSLPTVTTTSSGAFGTFFNDSENSGRTIDYVVVFMKLEVTQ